METRRDGITTWVATFSKNLFFLLLSTPYRMYMYIPLYIHTCTIT